MGVRVLVQIKYVKTSTQNSVSTRENYEHFREFVNELLRQRLQDMQSV